MPRVYALIYQCGIANVVRLQRKGKRTRVLQSDFRTCETFCLGLKEHGARILVRHANVAGDVLNTLWNIGPGTMFAESKANWVRQ